MSQRSQRTRSSQPGPSQPIDLDDSTEDDYSQATQYGSQMAPALPEDEENHLIANVIRYLMVADKSKTIIQRVNIIKHAMPNHGKYFKIIMAKVTDTLREVFGYKLVKLGDSKFILTNNLGHEDHRLELPEVEKKELVLLFIVLAHIFMTNDRRCEEEELFQLFKQLEIKDEDDSTNEYFGDVKYLLTDKFIKQGYLEVVNVVRSDPPKQHYVWGPRAENELRPRSVLEFMSKIFGGRPLNAWPDQFKLMQISEGNESTF